MKEKYKMEKGAIIKLNLRINQENKHKQRNRTQDLPTANLVTYQPNKYHIWSLGGNKNT